MMFFGDCMLVGTDVTYSAEQAEDQSFVLLPPSFSAPAKCCVNNEFLTIDPVSVLACVEVAGWIARWAVLSHVRRGRPLPPRRFSLTTTPLEHRTSASGRSILVPRMFCPTGSVKTSRASGLTNQQENTGPPPPNSPVPSAHAGHRRALTTACATS